MKITIKGQVAPKLTYEELERENGRLALKADQLHCDNIALLEMFRPLMDDVEWEKLERFYWMTPITKTIQ
jgi:hypothetical protein